MNEHINPNDYKVVEFINSTDFDFTPELGAMYDGRPFFVKSGEKRQLPYHVGHRLAENLAKQVLLKGAPAHDPKENNPVGTPLWDTAGLDRLKNSFLVELYSEEKAVSKTETDLLMERVKMLEEKFGSTKESEKSDIEDKGSTGSNTFKDKQEVIAELEKRGIKHDKRSTKDALEKLLVA
jgi:hypothetical protein